MSFCHVSRKSENYLSLSVDDDNGGFDRMSDSRTVGRMTMESTRRGLGHLLFRSLVCSHRSLIRLLVTARSLPSSWKTRRDLSSCNKCVDFIQIQPIVMRSLRFCSRSTSLWVAYSQPFENHSSCAALSYLNSTFLLRKCWVKARCSDGEKDC